MKNDPRSCQRDLYNCVRSMEKKIRTYFIYVEHNKKSNLLLISKANYKILFTVKFRLKNYE